MASLNSWGFFVLDAEQDGARLLAVAERAARSVSAQQCRLADSAVRAKGSPEPTVLSK